MSNGYFLMYQGASYVVETPEMKVRRLQPRGEVVDVEASEARLVLIRGHRIGEPEAMLHATVAIEESAPVQAAQRVIPRRRALLRGGTLLARRRESGERENNPERNALWATGGIVGVAALVSLFVNSGLGIFSETLVLLAVLPVVVFGIVFFAVATAGTAIGVLWFTEWARHALARMIRRLREA